MELDASSLIGILVLGKHICQLTLMIEDLVIQELRKYIGFFFSKSET